MKSHDSSLADGNDNKSLTPPRCGASELPPPDLSDPVLEIYKRDVDRTLLRRNLALTPAERAEKLVDFVRFLTEMRRGTRELHKRANEH